MDVPNLSTLADRDCLVTFAAMALNCDPSVSAHEYGYPDVTTAGQTFITAHGASRRTGLPVAVSDYALRRLQQAGLATPIPTGEDAWRPNTIALTDVVVSEERPAAAATTRPNDGR